MPVIQFDAVSKVFDTRAGRTVAVDDVTLDIEEGEIFGIIGYSGAGKSTLVRLINGLERVTSGRVVVAGTEVSALTERQLPDVRAQIGMIFQQFNLLRSRTVFGNVEFPLKVAGWPKQRREERVWELLDFVGLTQLAYKHPEQLSGGQKQRVGIARALAPSPTVLLADEATSALDPETTRDVLDLLRRTNREFGVTVVVITHEMDVIRSIADRVAVLDAGAVVEIGPTFDVFAHPRADMTRRFLATVSRDRPEDADLARIADGASGRLFVVGVTDATAVSDVLSDGAAGGVSFRLHFGGIDILQGKEYGSLTIELSGVDADVDAVVERLRRQADVTEVAA